MIAGPQVPPSNTHSGSSAVLIRDHKRDDLRATILCGPVPSGHITSRISYGSIVGPIAFSRLLGLSLGQRDTANPAFKCLYGRETIRARRDAGKAHRLGARRTKRRAGFVHASLYQRTPFGNGEADHRRPKRQAPPLQETEAPAFGYPGRNQRDLPLLAISRGAGELASAAGRLPFTDNSGACLRFNYGTKAAQCSAPTARPRTSRATHPVGSRAPSSEGVSEVLDVHTFPHLSTP